MTFELRYLDDPSLYPFLMEQNRVLLGTLPSNDLVLTGEGIEPIHAVLEESTEGTWIITDLGSSSGVLVNGKRIEVERRIKTNDKIKIGSVQLAFAETTHTDTRATVASPLPQQSTKVGEIKHVDAANPVSAMTRLFNPKKARPTGGFLEVVSYWGDSVIAVELFDAADKKQSRVVSIGQPPIADLLAGGDSPKLHRFIRYNSGGFQIKLLGDMKGKLRAGGKLKSIKGPGTIKLSKRDIAQINHGALTYFVMFVQPPAIKLPPAKLKDPLFTRMSLVAFMLFLLICFMALITDPQPKDEFDDDIWEFVNLPEVQKEEKKEKFEPPKPEQKIVEVKKTPPPPPPPPKPEPPKPVQAEVTKKPVPPVKPPEKKKEDVKKSSVATLNDAAKDRNRKNRQRPQVNFKRNKESAGAPSTGARNPDGKLAGNRNKAKPGPAGGNKGSGNSKSGGERKGKRNFNVKGVEDKKNAQASGVNLSKIGKGFGKILNKDGAGAIKTPFRTSGGGIGGGAGSGSKTTGLGGIGKSGSLKVAGVKSGIESYGSGSGGAGSGAGGTGGLGGSGLGGKGFKGGSRRGRSAPPIPPGDPVVSGGLTSQEVSLAIRANLNQIRHCYETLLQRSPSAQGRVRVKFTVTPAGRVSNASVVSSTINDSRMTGCVIGKIRRWRFPKPRGGQSVTVRYPFVFNPL